MDYKLLNEDTYLNLLIDSKLSSHKRLTEEQELNILLEDLRKDLIEISSTGDLLGGLTVRLSKGETNIAAGVVAAAVIYGVYKLGKGLAQKLQHKKCRQYKLNSPAQRKCNNEVEITIFEKQITILKSKMSLCSQSKDKAKCEAKIKKKILELQHKIKTKKARNKELESQV